jgi:putative glutamine amidotransferase
MPVPLVGVTCYRRRAQWGSWSRPAAVLPTSYLETVAAAGGRPVVVPPLDGEMAKTAEAVEATVTMLDALVLAGGEDLGEDPLRDAAERSLLAAALDRGMPVLAICRGMQLLNVAMGGSLIEDLPSVGIEGHRPEPGKFSRVTVTTESFSRLRSMVGREAAVACSHHQAVDRLGEHLWVSARSADGLVEAVEMEGEGFVVGVQWHPEEDGDLRLFKGLIGSVGASTKTVQSKSVTDAMSELFIQRARPR